MRCVREKGSSPMRMQHISGLSSQGGRERAVLGSGGRKERIRIVLFPELPKTDWLLYGPIVTPCCKDDYEIGLTC